MSGFHPQSQINKFVHTWKSCRGEMGRSGSGVPGLHQLSCILEDSLNYRVHFVFSIKPYANLTPGCVESFRCVDRS